MRHIRALIYAGFSGLALPKPGWQSICLCTELWKSHLLKVKSRQMCKDSEQITKNPAFHRIFPAIVQAVISAEILFHIGARDEINPILH